ncbi:transporter substrate-binding domain-containing protein [Vibrio sp. Of7-15]|uniref:substrate-binding periplasmic protein n=1 Tax=Vibrio sp. Of7-15 TaxID=2724879 RepID=UPI001EF353C5|nr:transporter substrate-binding domain-containing protein [Vibrio sp. Of7-15]MCG7498322.1 transporter substrate-binding domain-containing protein [Vibrio sp. Of7-15]
MDSRIWITLYKKSARLLCILWLTFFSAITSADVITIVADEWYPYNGTPDSSKPGYGIEVIQRIFEKHDHTIEYTVLPWNRAIHTTRRGSYNAIIGAIKADAPDFIFPEQELGYSQDAFYVAKDSSWSFSDIHSLSKMRIGLIKDYAYDDSPLTQFVKRNPNNVYYSLGQNALEPNIRKLLNNHLDVLVEDKNVFAHTTQDMALHNQFKYAGNLGKGSHIYVAFSPQHKKSKEYAEIFSQGMKQLKESGELEKILKKYGLQYWHE